ncbi:MAG: hypothetical protein ACLQNE_22155, partial [Thermoguttaceae bacterium]
PWRSSPNVAYIPKSNGTQDPERHGVRSLQDSRRIATLTVGELNHAKKRRQAAALQSPFDARDSPTNTHLAGWF